MQKTERSARVSCISGVSITTLSSQISFDAVLRDRSHGALICPDLDALRSVMDPVRNAKPR